MPSGKTDKSRGQNKAKTRRRNGRKAATESTAAAAESRREGQAPQTLPSPKPEVVVVGIGASAGGLSALKEFFRNVADDSGLAYVVIVHLSPERESHMANLLQPHSTMKMLQVTETVPLKPNCVYIIPPNANLSAIDTHLRLSALEQRRAERAPIDHFFRTLAQTHDGHAIGVILTGTGSDGTLGIKEIKLRGGLTVVQDPNEAEYDGMPHSAITTGLVDMVLPLSSIPGAVLQFARTVPRLPVASDGKALEAEHQSLLQKMFAQIDARTGRDFTHYKHSTIMRRVQRRMQLRYIDELEKYIDFLRQAPDEVRALSDDLLINVTSFFRDASVFRRLQEDIVPRLFDNKGPDDEIRVWCAGCATGEEVYSLAILLLEEAARKGHFAPHLHIFASDLHERSLQMAREGFYPGDISTDVSAGRLNRFFVNEAGGYRIRKQVREKVVFAPHNLLSDPPFSRLDLILCRNLLIYLQRDVQSEVLRIFHYALRPGGYLVLGTAESVDDAELFRAVDKRLSIYRRGITERVETRVPVFPISYVEQSKASATADEAVPPQNYASIHAEMTGLYAPPSLLVGPDGQIVHLSDTAGRYLAHPGGRVTNSATKLVRKELAAELITALHAARREQRPVRSNPVTVQFNGERRSVVVHVRPSASTRTESYSLVIFEERDKEVSDGAVAGIPDNERVAELARELDTTRDRLQTIVEEFETSQEEMRISNEELQSANEELRSTMEELETSKEELQSMNEELQTMNQENRQKVEELASLTSDLENLLTSTEIATLFVDRELRILRFTPKLLEIFNMRSTDRGRPFSDLTHHLGYPELEADAENVLRRTVPIEREVKDDAGRWYLTNLLPYRGHDESVKGVLLTFVDITRRKNSEDQIRELTRNLEKRVAERTRQVRELTISLVRAEQRERRRLSATLHDELQQLLYGVQLKLRMLRDETPGSTSGEAEQHLRQAEELLQKSTQVTRQLSVDLNPPILKNEGLRAILDWLQSFMRDLHGLAVEVDTQGEIRIDDGDVRVLLYQIFRELLFNVAKHAGAGKARVSLREANGELHVEVTDDGRGFDLRTISKQAPEKPSIGLTNVKERIGLLGGRMEVASAPGEGTTISIRLPRSAKIDP